MDRKAHLGLRLPIILILAVMISCVLCSGALAADETEDLPDTYVLNVQLVTLNSWEETDAYGKTTVHTSLNSRREPDGRGGYNTYNASGELVDASTVEIGGASSVITGTYTTGIAQDVVISTYSGFDLTGVLINCDCGAGDECDHEHISGDDIFSAVDSAFTVTGDDGYGVVDETGKLVYDVVLTFTKRISYDVTIICGPNGSTSPTYATVYKGDAFIIEVNPDSGYVVKKFVTTTGSYKVSGKNYTIKGMNADTTVTVEFEESYKSYKITKSGAGAGGLITGPDSIRENGSFTFVATANNDYYISAIKVNGTVVYTGDLSSYDTTFSYTVTDVTKNTTVAVTFTKIPYYKLTVTGDGKGGSVYLSGVVTDNTCRLGSNRTVYIEADEGYTIGSIKVDGTSLREFDSKTESYTFDNISQAHSVAVVFNKIATYKITVSANKGGVVSPVTVEVIESYNKPFLILADDGYIISEIKVDGVLQTGYDQKKHTYTFYNVKAAHTLAVTFLEAPFYELTVTHSEGGTVLPTTISKAKGENETVKVTPDEGYHVQSVVIDGVNMEIKDSYTFREIAAPHTIDVTFAKEPVFSFNIKATEGGYINPTTADVTYGDNAVFRFFPDDGYYIADILIDGLSIGRRDNYTFYDVTDVHSVDAIFSDSADSIIYNEEFPAPPTSSTVYTTPYTDVAGRWSETSIVFATQKGLFNGVTETEFAPEENMTRAMFVVVLARTFGINLATYDGGGFSDVNEGAWYARAVSWASRQAIASGTGWGLFSPDDGITREEIAVLMQRAAKYAGLSSYGTAALSGYADYSQISSWARDAMSYAVSSGLMQGYNNRLSPTATVTREEVAAIMQRFYGIIHG